MTAAAVVALVLMGAGSGMAQNGGDQVASIDTNSPSDAQLQPQVSALAAEIVAAINGAEESSRAQGLSPEDTRAAVQAAIQNAIARSGQSPRVVESAVVAVRRCPTGIPTSTTNLPPSNLVTLPCVTGLLKPLSDPAQLALGGVEDTVLALLEGDVRPAALSDDGPGGGLGTPPSGGLASGGGSDYLP